MAYSHIPQQIALSHATHGLSIHPDMLPITGNECANTEPPRVLSTLLDNEAYRTLTRNTGLIRKAIVKRWPVDPALKEAVLEKARQWLADGNLSAKEQAAWAKVIVAAEAQNQADEQRAEEYQRLDEGKLTANSGHTLILDGPIRPQMKQAAIMSVSASEPGGGRELAPAKEAPAALPPPAQELIK